MHSAGSSSSSAAPTQGDPGSKRESKAMMRCLWNGIEALNTAEKMCDLVLNPKERNKQKRELDDVSREFQTALQSAAKELGHLAQVSHQFDTIGVPGRLLEAVDNGDSPELVMREFCDWTEKKNDHSRGRLWNSRATSVHIRRGLKELRDSKKRLNNDTADTEEEKMDLPPSISS